GKKAGSLLGLLDQTATAMGSRLLKKWLDKPLLDVHKIEERQQVVQALMEEWILQDEIRDKLKEVYDLERLSARIAYGSANGRDLLALQRSLKAIPGLKQELIQTGNPALKQIAEEMDPLTELADRIEQSIAEEAPVTIREGNLIRDGYDEELDRLRMAKREGKDWIARLQQQEREKTGIKSLK
ncbi:DNA mismatch repair protein MutS, partial [Klebsiella pneumoniae]